MLQLTCAAVDAELEEAVPFDEERPLLRKEGLEGAEVEDRRIGLDLAEVGIDRAGERQVRTPPPP